MRRFTTLLLLSACVAAVPAVAQQRSQIGFHAGINFDIDDPLIGAQVIIPVGPRVDAYPSYDYYFVDPGSLSGLNLDIRYRPPASNVTPYLGGGINLLYGNGDTDGGISLFGGIEGRGKTRPYGELRALLHDSSSLQIVGGLNFRL